MRNSDNKAFLKSDLSTKVIILSSLFSSLSSFALIPFLPIILSIKAGWHIGAIGFVLAIMNFIKFSGGFLTAFIINRINVKSSLLIGLIIQIVGFILLLLKTSEFFIIWISLFQIALGEAIYVSSNKVYLVSSVSNKIRSRILAISNSFIHTGILVGPIIGGVLAINYTNQLFF